MILKYPTLKREGSVDTWVHMRKLSSTSKNNEVETNVDEYKITKIMDFKEAKERSQKIRKLYHQLERQHHGSEWTVEEDALAFLTDAGLIGRLTMSQQGRWPKGDNAIPELEHKLGE